MLAGVEVWNQGAAVNQVVMARNRSGADPRRAGLFASGIVLFTLIGQPLFKMLLSPVLATACAFVAAALLVLAIDWLLGWRRGRGSNP